jgi:enamine deaminase RidA (YjgF/YER057c/UK114 family)
MCVRIRFIAVFTAPYPARAAYQVGALPKAGLVEIEAVAVVGDIVDQ